VLRYDLSRAVWRTSSYSGTNGACVEVAVVPAWRTSTHSGQNGACAEVARNLPGVVGVRDSKDRGGPVLMFGPADWEAFTKRIRADELG
jgi:hypothetical protein